VVEFDNSTKGDPADDGADEGAVEEVDVEDIEYDEENEETDNDEKAESVEYCLDRKAEGCLSLLQPG